MCGLTHTHTHTHTHTDEFTLPPDTPLPTKQLLTASWQGDFLPVAQALLTRIKAHHTELVPLEPL